MKTKNRNKWRRPAQAVRLFVGVLTLALASASFGQEAKPAEKYVTREEYDKVVKELETIKKKHSGHRA